MPFDNRSDYRESPLNRSWVNSCGSDEVAAGEGSQGFCIEQRTGNCCEHTVNFVGIALSHLRSVVIIPEKN